MDSFCTRGWRIFFKHPCPGIRQPDRVDTFWKESWCSICICVPLKNHSCCRFLDTGDARKKSLDRKLSVQQIAMRRKIWACIEKVMRIGNNALIIIDERAVVTVGRIMFWVGSLSRCGVLSSMESTARGDSLASITQRRPAISVWWRIRKWKAARPTKYLELQMQCDVPFYCFAFSRIQGAGRGLDEAYLSQCRRSDYFPPMLIAQSQQQIVPELYNRIFWDITRAWISLLFALDVNSPASLIVVGSSGAAVIRHISQRSAIFQATYSNRNGPLFAAAGWRVSI